MDSGLPGNFNYFLLEQQIEYGVIICDIKFYEEIISRFVINFLDLLLIFYYNFICVCVFEHVCVCLSVCVCV